MQKWDLDKRNNRRCNNAAIYDNVDNSHPNLIITVKDNKYGFLDYKGNELFKPIFNVIDIDNFDKLILVRYNNKIGFLNEYGKIVADIIYDDVDNSHPNLVITVKDNKYGFFDYKGKLISKPVYQSINPNDSLYIIVKYNDRYGIISVNGQIVTPIKFDTIGTFKNNKAYACIKDEKFYINKSGNRVSNPVFDNK
jgi:hypothetical protein